MSDVGEKDRSLPIPEKVRHFLRTRTVTMNLHKATRMLGLWAASSPAPSRKAIFRLFPDNGPFQMQTLNSGVTEAMGKSNPPLTARKQRPIIEEEVLQKAAQHAKEHGIREVPDSRELV